MRRFDLLNCGYDIEEATSLPSIDVEVVDTLTYYEYCVEVVGGEVIV